MIEEIPNLEKYLPDNETVEMVSKTVPPTKCVISKEKQWIKQV